MKLQIDTVKKTIVLEESVNLDEFFREIRSLLEPEELIEYTMQVGFVQNLPPTITYPNYLWNPWNPYIPYNDPYKVTCSADPIDKNYNTTK